MTFTITVPWEAAGTVSAALHGAAERLRFMADLIARPSAHDAPDYDRVGRVRAHLRGAQAIHDAAPCGSGSCRVTGAGFPPPPR